MNTYYPSAHMRRLANNLLRWHGGGGSGLYAVGSAMLAACLKPRRYEADAEQTRRALYELTHLKQDAEHPECVSKRDIADCNRLARILQGYVPSKED